MSDDKKDIEFERNTSGIDQPPGQISSDQPSGDKPVLPPRAAAALQNPSIPPGHHVFNNTPRINHPNGELPLILGPLATEEERTAHLDLQGQKFGVLRLGGELNEHYQQRLLKHVVSRPANLVDEEITTDEEAAFHAYVDDYIKSLTWQGDATDMVKTLVAGNIRAFAVKMLKDMRENNL